MWCHGPLLKLCPLSLLLHSTPCSLSPLTSWPPWRSTCVKHPVQTQPKQVPQGPMPAHCPLSTAPAPWLARVELPRVPLQVCFCIWVRHSALVVIDHVTAKQFDDCNGNILCLWNQYSGYATTSRIAKCYRVTGRLPKLCDSYLLQDAQINSVIYL